MRTPILSAAGLTLLATALSSCGGGSSHTVANRTATIAPPVPTYTRTVTTPATTTTTDTTPSASTPCTSADLSLAFEGSNGATGNIVLYLELRNTGSQACHTFGYPGVEFLAQDGTAIATATKRTTSDMLGQTPKTAIVLAPGEAASFRMVAPVNGPESSCTNASGLQVIPPDDTSTLHIAFRSALLQCGKTSVSPLEPGTAAIPAGT